MIRSALSVDQLEDRTTPVSLTFKTVISVSVSTPPQDPMDNPPPVQPGGTGGSGSTTSPPVSPPPPPPGTLPTY